MLAKLGGFYTGFAYSNFTIYTDVPCRTYVAINKTEIICFIIKFVDIICTKYVKTFILKC